MHSVRPWSPTSLWGSRWTSVHTWNGVVIIIEWVRLPACQWPKVGLCPANDWLKKFEQTLYFLSFFIAIFGSQANINCSIDSISWPISSYNHNSTDQAIGMDIYQSYVIRLDNFSFRKQQVAVKTDQKIYSLLIYNFIYNLIYDFFLSKDFQSSYITFDIFNNLTFFGTTE